MKFYRTILIIDLVFPTIIKFQGLVATQSYICKIIPYFMGYLDIWLLHLSIV